METSHDPTTRMGVRHDAAATEKVHDLMKAATFAMFDTYDARGACHSRPMVASAQEGGSLWFFTRDESRKIDELHRDSRVRLDYADGSDQNYVSAQGTARVVHDRDTVEELWSEPLRTWFPEGKDDLSIALIEVELDSAEYWDTPSSMMVHAFGYVKARLTGRPPAPGEVAQVRM